MPRQPISYSQAKSIKALPYRRLARRVPAATKKYVKRQILRDEETKSFYSSDLTNSLSYDNATLFNMTNVSQGDNYNSRDGNKIRAVALTIKGRLRGGPADTTARVIVFQWKKDNNVDTPAITDLFRQGAGAGAEYIEPLNLQNRKYYKILSDKRYSVGTTTVANSTGGLPSDILISHYIPASKFAKIIDYNDNAGTGKNMIYVIAFSDVTDASGNEPILSMQSRFDFKEM